MFHVARIGPRYRPDRPPFRHKPAPVAARVGPPSFVTIGGGIGPHFQRRDSEAVLGQSTPTGTGQHDDPAELLQAVQRPLDVALVDGGHLGQAAA